MSEEIKVKVVEHHPTVFVATYGEHGERGRTAVEAVGRLVLLHPEIFHVKAIWGGRVA